MRQAQIFSGETSGPMAQWRKISFAMMTQLPLKRVFNIPLRVTMAWMKRSAVALFCCWRWMQPPLSKKRLFMP
jgi:hypothetical protein